MQTRSSDNWKTTPGNFDTLRMRQLFPSTTKYGIPDLALTTEQELPEPPTALIPYNIRVRSKYGYKDAAMMFMIDDYRFEFVWNSFHQALSRVQRAWLTLTPDFSLYAEYPIAAQIWNTYRSRWCGVYWQKSGMVVVPSIAWSTKESFDFCFDGVPHTSPVAIATQGMHWDTDTTKRFEEGMNEMMQRINPRFVICYGKLDNKIKNRYPDTEIKCYPSYWETKKRAEKLGKEKEFFSGSAEIHNGII